MRLRRNVSNLLSPFFTCKKTLQFPFLFISYCILCVFSAVIAIVYTFIVRILYNFLYPKGCAGPLLCPAGLEIRKLATLLLIRYESTWRDTVTGFGFFDRPLEAVMKV